VTAVRWRSAANVSSWPGTATNHSPDNIFIHLPDHDNPDARRHRQPGLGAGVPE